MRYLIALWALPLAVFWGWFFLSANDISFGFLILSRDVHDFVFEIYGNILGIDPDSIPGLVARACVIDTLLIMAIYAFRKRAAIIAWVRETRAGYLTRSAAPEAGPIPPAE